MNIVNSWITYADDRIIIYIYIYILGILHPGMSSKRAGWKIHHWVLWFRRFPGGRGVLTAMERWCLRSGSMNCSHLKGSESHFAWLWFAYGWSFVITPMTGVAGLRHHSAQWKSSGPRPGWTSGESSHWTPGIITGHGTVKKSSCSIHHPGRLRSLEGLSHNSSMFMIKFTIVYLHVSQNRQLYSWTMHGFLSRTAQVLVLRKNMFPLSISYSPT